MLDTLKRYVDKYMYDLNDQDLGGDVHACTVRDGELAALAWVQDKIKKLEDQNKST